MKPRRFQRHELPQLRKERGLNQTQLGDLVGVGQSLISKMEKPWGEKGAEPIPTRKRELYPGQREIDPEYLLEPSIKEELEEVFGMNADDLREALDAVGDMKKVKEEPHAAGSRDEVKKAAARALGKPVRLDD